MKEPPGFRRLEASGAVLVVAERHHEEVVSLELLEPSAFARWRASGKALRGGRAQSVRVVLPESGTAIHLRPLAHGGWLRGITGRRFRNLDRPLQELTTAAALRARQVRVPEPVFALGRRRGLFWEIDVASRFVEPSISLDRWLSDAGSTRALGSAGSAVRRFHDAGGSHGDLHVGNILIDPDRPSEANAVTVVDLDGSRVLAEVCAAQRERERARFERSLRKRHPKIAAACCRAFRDGYETGS